MASAWLTTLGSSSLTATHDSIGEQGLSESDGEDVKPVNKWKGFIQNGGTVWVNPWLCAYKILSVLSNL